ncbi:hypothetical protein EXM65_12990 [Clostridium botulinum]|uniref:Carboxymuconolactone decarboxylase family protein n=1 Tax=Clostridium botulinum TaxID=1491 RepID=A0A6M0SSW6_CLOBO|nr:hypothetical protein [Clostridium botulinum]
MDNFNKLAPKVEKCLEKLNETINYYSILEPRIKELALISAFAAIQDKRGLKEHIKIALEIGVCKRQLISLVLELIPIIGTNSVLDIITFIDKELFYIRKE